MTTSNTQHNKGVFNTIRKKQGGFTLIELGVVLLVLGTLAYFTVPAIQGFLSSSKVDSARLQVDTLVRAAQSFGKRNGDKTGISIQALTDRGLVPLVWVDGTGINPWAGDISIAVDTDVTQVVIRFLGIDDDAAGLRFEDDLNNGFAVSATYTSGTLQAVFEAG
jgi:type IV pilus assembly protein PilA